MRARIGSAVVAICMILGGVLLPTSSALGAADRIGLAGMNATGWSQLANLDPGVLSGSFSSYDRKDANDDGFGGKGFLYEDSHGDQVIAELKGAGEITHMMFVGTWDRVNTIVKMYFDGESVPRVEKSMQALFDGVVPPPSDPPNAFVAPLTVPPRESAGSNSTYLPLPFATSIKISVRPASVGSPPDQVGYVYNIDYKLYPAGTDVTSFNPDNVDTSVGAIWDALGSDPKGSFSGTTSTGTVTVPGNGVSTIYDSAGPGSLSAIKLGIPGVPGTESNDYAMEILNNLSIRIYWDREQAPSVDAPLGAFFGLGNFGSPKLSRTPTVPLAERDTNLGTAQSLAMGIDDSDQLYMYFPMPFKQHALVQLYSNRATSTTNVNYTIQRAAFSGTFADTGYFKTQYQFTRARVADPFDYVALDVVGAGKYLGLTMSGSGAADPAEYLDQAMHYLEGDEHIYVDGSETPQWNGTGTEDYYNGAGYFCCTNGDLSYPGNVPGWGWFSNAVNGYTNRQFSPVDLSSGMGVNGTGNTSMYRVQANDAVPFRNHIRVSFEHGGGPRDTDNPTIGANFENQNSEFGLSPTTTTSPS